MMTLGIESGGEELRVSGPRGKALGPGKAEGFLGFGARGLGPTGSQQRRKASLPPAFELSLALSL